MREADKWIQECLPSWPALMGPVPEWLEHAPPEVVAAYLYPQIWDVVGGGDCPECFSPHA